jgi:voltage-gated potassium channel
MTIPDAGSRTAGRLVAALRRQPLTARRAAVIIGGYTALTTLAGGVLAWLIDRKDFNSLGDAVWWSLQSVTTVGYGDVVPTAGSGRVIGAVVMMSGIAFLTVITAAVTATLIEAARRRLPPRPHSEIPAEFMEAVTSRLSAIEARLDEQRARDRE